MRTYTGYEGTYAGLCRGPLSALKLVPLASKSDAASRKPGPLLLLG